MDSISPFTVCLGNYFWLKAFDHITLLILDHEHLGFLLVILRETCDGF